METKMTDVTVANGNGSDVGELIRQLAELRAVNEALRAKANKSAMSRLKLKVSDKGAVSLYGMGRFPVTLYGEQWAKLIEFVPEIKEFLADHKDELSVKA